ncbi:MAG TPA: CRISPR-associated endonuclease Cas2 [Candidatus Fimimorpha excrementavium]|nr:CRISPR-associated endonuclease Cas2 [Candidatus Fimimorpha excrementavium]
MFLILVYDVSQKRVSKVHKICQRYLYAVQRSVFEGSLTEKQLHLLQNDLAQVINTMEDSVCIYRFDSLLYTSKEQIGCSSGYDSIL